MHIKIRVEKNKKIDEIFANQKKICNNMEYGKIAAYFFT